MLFNSYEFLFIFLPITLLVYFTLAKYKYTKLATVSLVVASLSFYSYWDIRYLPLLLASIVFNFTIGSQLERTRDKKTLVFGIAVNLLLLGYFKYIGFFIQSINIAAGSAFFVPEIVLPLGISFFTFTQTAYLIDAYRGETKSYSFLTYCLFVTVFPHLIAGPILYHKDMIPQFSRIKNFVFNHKNFAVGLSIFSMGLFKKVIIADTLAPWVKIVFDNANNISFLESWAGAIAYTLQLYFDFSGYSEMAIGLGLLFNLSLPINFNSPYQATSIIDFWRRWHITLSEFLKNYLYIPLGGNRKGQAWRMFNLMATMLLGGLWHGAGVTFIIWGGLHGLYLAINHTWRKLNFSLPTYIAWTITFLCVVVAWVFFRAHNVYDAMMIIKSMFGFKGVKFAELKYLKDGKLELLFIFLLTVLVATIKNPNQYITNFNPTWKWAGAISVALALALFGITRVSEFLYFQF